MIVGFGCAGLVSLCCLGTAAFYLYQDHQHRSAGTEFAEELLHSVSRGDLNDAASFISPMRSPSRSEAEAFQRCLRATVLGDLTSYDCHDASGLFATQTGVDVECSVTSASHGESEITIHVHSPRAMSFVGAMWFSSGTWTGPSWTETECGVWSGMYEDGAPSGRVMPSP